MVVINDNTAAAKQIISCSNAKDLLPLLNPVQCQPKCGRDSRKRSSVLWLDVNLEIEHVSNHTKHFDGWKAWCKNQKDDLDSFEGVKRWDQIWISATTLKNLKICVFGFLNCAKDVLSDPSSQLKCVPFLHNNSSTIESTFSTLCATIKDTAISLEKDSLVQISRPHRSWQVLHQILLITAQEETKICIHQNLT